MCADKELEAFKRDCIARFGEERGTEIYHWYAQRKVEQWSTSAEALAMIDADKRWKLLSADPYAGRYRPEVA